MALHTDRGAVHRWHRRLVLAHVLATVAVVALLVVVVTISSRRSLSAGFLLLLLVIVLTAEVFQLGYHCYVWGTRAALSTPAVITTAGLRMTVAQGEVFLPWDAVGAMSVRTTKFGRVLTVHPHPGVRVDSPGVSLPFRERTWSRVLQHGLRLGERGLVEDLDHVAAAIYSASAGGVTVR